MTRLSAPHGQMDQTLQLAANSDHIRSPSVVPMYGSTSSLGLLVYIGCTNRGVLPTLAACRYTQVGENNASYATVATH